MSERAEAAEVTNLTPEDIAPNPHNPRRLFDEEPMRILRESIRKLGVLVPVAVYRRASYDPRRTGLTPYVLLDGERRLRCVKELGLSKIPAIIVGEPTEVSNILTMFHIHNVREGWQLMPTALKLQTLMEDLKTENERELASLTQLSISQIRRCRRLLSYDEKYQNMMLAPESERLKADFLIELERIRRPALKEGFPPWVERGDNECIDIMLRKYQNGVIKAVTEFRELAAKYRAAVDYEKLDIFYAELDRFLGNEEVTIDEITVPGAEYRRLAFEVRRSSRRLMTQLSRLDDEALAADEELVSVLHKLLERISERLRDALVIEARDELS